MDFSAALGLKSAELRSPRLWTPVIVAIVVAAILIPASALVTGGGHGRYLLVVASFPYVFVLGTILRQSVVLTTLFFWAPALALIAEVPFYGVLIGLVQVRRIATWWIAVAALAHAVAFVLSITLLDSGHRLF